MMDRLNSVNSANIDTELIFKNNYNLINKKVIFFNWNSMKELILYLF